jgi:hypothetical protein
MTPGFGAGLVIPDLWQQEAVRALQQRKESAQDSPAGSTSMKLKSSLTAAGLVWRQENHADKLREGREELNEYEGEERPEAIPDRKVDRLERHRHCANGSYSVEEKLVHRLHVSASK